jgi:hypothetical protein
MLKLAGVLVVGLTINDVLLNLIDILDLAIYTDEWFSHAPSGTRLEDLMALGYTLLTTLAPLLAGLYLVFGGEWIVRRLVPNHRTFCEHCGYRLSGTAHERCPECGVELHRDVEKAGGTGQG